MGSARRPQESQRKVEDNGLELAALHIGGILTPTVEMTRALTDYTKHAIESAHEIGCPTDGVIYDVA